MNRTSNTRSASSGTPYLKPKLMIWSATWSGSSVASMAARIALPELALRQVGGVDDHLAPCSRTSSSMRRSRRSMAAMPDAASRSGMAVAGLAEAADEHLVGRLEEEDLGSMPRPWSAPSAAPRASGASPERTSSTMRHPPIALRVVGHQLRQVAQQLGGHVVDDRVAEVLEQLAGGRLAGAREPVMIATCWPAQPARGVGSTPSGRAPARPQLSGSVSRAAAAASRASSRADDEDGELVQGVHHAAHDDRADGVAAGRDHHREDDDAQEHVAAAGLEPLDVQDAQLGRARTSTIGNSITAPKMRKIMVTKPKYASAVARDDQ